jgi:hypothetical protein
MGLFTFVNTSNDVITPTFDTGANKEGSKICWAPANGGGMINEGSVGFGNMDRFYVGDGRRWGNTSSSFGGAAAYKAMWESL